MSSFSDVFCLVSSWSAVSFVVKWLREVPLCPLSPLCPLCLRRLTQQVAIGVEARRDRFTYHFDNPSSFDTPFLVPHFFEQRYVADNVWLMGSASYAAGIRWETSAGITPQRTATGDDYDTFLNPDGTVYVSGTTGGISIRSLRSASSARSRVVALSRSCLAIGCALTAPTSILATRQ